MTSWLNINSPSKRARDVLGKNWALGIGVGFENDMPIKGMVSTVSDAMDEVAKLTPELDVNMGVDALRTGTLSSARASEQSDTEREIIEKLEGVMTALQALGNTSIVLNNGVLVGQLAPEIDRKLGALASRKMRG
jgi:hypothetical protein